MSYNIDNFHVREIENFRFENCSKLRMGSIKALFFNNGDAHLDVEYFKKGRVFKVNDIAYRGIGSGCGWKEFWKVLETTKGHLKALVVWESGDSVDYLTVDDGIVKLEGL